MCIRDSATTPFSTYCPKVIAGINSLSPALEDRCITIEMQKAAASKKVSYLTNDDRNKLESLKPVIVRTLDKRMPELIKIINNPASLKLNPEIQNRELEKWFPILAIAKVFSTKKNNYFEQIQNFALDSIISSIQEDASPETICRSILIDFLAGNAAKTLLPGDKKYFVFRTERIFKMIKKVDAHNSYRNQAELTKVLKKLGVITGRKRFGADPISIYLIPRTMINKKKEK